MAEDPRTGGSLLSLVTDYPEIPDTVPRRDIRKEGDFFIDKIELITYKGDVYKLELLRVEMSIHEDLFNPVLSGVIWLQDSSDLTQFLPLIGEETLKVSFTRPDESGRGLLDDYYEAEFRIYKIESRRPEADKMNVQNYGLHFVSKEKITDMKTKVWQTYEDMPYSDMVQKIFDEYIKSSKPLVVEPTMYEFKFAASGMSPFDIIHILASKSISAEGNGSAYVFYEDMDQFNFVTLGKLMKQGSDVRFLSQLGNVLEDKGTVKRRDRDIEIDVRRVENYRWASSFDVIGRLQNGMYAQQLWAVDTLRQIWEKHDWDYKKEFPGLPHVDSDDICTDALDALGSPPTVMRLMETTRDHDIVPHIVAKEPGIKPNKIEEHVLKRASQLEQALGHRMQINVSGDPRRRTGKVIEFMTPNHYGAYNEDHRPDPPHDRYLSGKHLIVSCKHRIEAHRYYGELEIMKDSLAQGIEGVDLIEQQEWTW